MAKMNVKTMRAMIISCILKQASLANFYAYKVKAHGDEYKENYTKARGAVDALAETADFCDIDVEIRYENVISETPTYKMVIIDGEVFLTNK